MHVAPCQIVQTFGFIDLCPSAPVHILIAKQIRVCAALGQKRRCLVSMCLHFLALVCSDLHLCVCVQILLHFVQAQYQTYCSGTVAKAKAKMAKVTKPFKEKKEKKSKSEKKQVEQRGDKTGARKAVEGVPEQPPGVPWTVGPWKGCASPDEIEKADELMIARLKRGWSERPDPRTISSTAASSSGSARPLEEDDDRTETEAPQQQEVKPKAPKAKAKGKDAKAKGKTKATQLKEKGKGDPHLF